MNGYIAIYKGKRLEVYAKSSYEAQKQASITFKAKKSYDVDVYLCDREDKTQAIQTITN